MEQFYALLNELQDVNALDFVVRRPLLRRSQVHDLNSPQFVAAKYSCFEIEEKEADKP